MIAAPVDDADVPRYWRELGLPGLVDVHVHFLPDRMQAKVWQFFAEAARNYGRPWPIHYELPVDERLAVPTTCAPSATAIWTAKKPTPPAARCTRTRSPSPTSSVSVSAW